MSSNVSGFLAKFGPGTMEEPPEPQSLVIQPGVVAENFVRKFAGFTESYWFYNNTCELTFDKVAHLYFLVNPELGNLTPLNGVTNTCHIIDRSMRLMPWAAKVVVEKLLRIMPKITTPEGVISVPQMSLEDFTLIAMEAKSAPTDERDDAGDVGSMAHECLEASILAALSLTNGQPAKVEELVKLPKDERAVNCVNNAKGWMDRHNVRWLNTEQKVFSKKYLYAGTFDGDALVDSCDDPTCCEHQFKDQLSLIDWKSSNYLSIEYLFQTAAYQGARFEELGIEYKARWVNRLGKEDGDFQPWYLPAEDFEQDWAGWLACLELARLVDGVEERMKGQRTHKRAIEKAARQLAKEKKKAEERIAKAKLKAEKKAEREAEKERIKAEAKVAREAAKVAKKAEAEKAKEEARLARKHKAKGEEARCEPAAGPSVGSTKLEVKVEESRKASFSFEEPEVSKPLFNIPQEG